MRAILFITNLLTAVLVAPAAVDAAMTGHYKAAAALFIVGFFNTMFVVFELYQNSRRLHD